MLDIHNNSVAIFDIHASLQQYCSYGSPFEYYTAPVATQFLRDTIGAAQELDDSVIQAKRSIKSRHPGHSSSRDTIFMNSSAASVVHIAAILLSKRPIW